MILRRVPFTTTLSHRHMIRLMNFILANLVIYSSLMAQQVGQKLPLWQPGYLDIHHINTGHGDAAFYIFPDGTTMLLDAGEMDPNSSRVNSPRNSKLHPNTNKRAYEWIADYIKLFHPTPSNPSLDYAVITHFHDDHFGSYYEGARRSASGDYFLSGITGVGEMLKFRKLLDRGYPDYNYPHDLKKDSILKIGVESPDEYKAIVNYWKFTEYHKHKYGMVVEQFSAGSSKQISLQKDAEKFKTFQVQNIKANGTIWSGKRHETIEYFPPLSTGLYVPGENQLSLALRVDYGAFRYYTGGAPE
jgi:hypothetical protein